MTRPDEGKKSDKKHILDVVSYFSLFQYAPTDQEIYSFFPLRRPKTHIMRKLVEMVEEKKLVFSSKSIPSQSIYAIPGYSIYFDKRPVRKANALKKLQRVQWYFRILYLSSWVRLVGISGSCAMYNANASDDVDIFIIAARNRLWLTRLWSLLLAEAFMMRRRRGQTTHAGKICLNMFFEESHMKLPDKKMSLYTAHEVVQMRPILMRDGAYYHRLFLKANTWIKYYFPNIRFKKIPFRKAKTKSILRIIFTKAADVFEALARKFQMTIIARHRTKEIISNRQLWFFPHDFELKVRRNFDLGDGLIEDSSSRSR